MLVLTRQQVEALVTVQGVIPMMRDLFIEIGKGEVAMPLRTALPTGDGGDTVLFMPGHVRRMHGIGLKIVSVFPRNPSERGLPTIHATIVLNDPATGQVTAVMDGTHITALRTAAVSAVAAEALALPGASRLGVLGSGVQARSHIDAILAVRPVTDVAVYGRNAAGARAMADEMRARHPGCRFECAASPEAAVAGRQIVVTATTSPVPVFDGRALEPGTHVNAIGAFTPAHRELDDETMRRAAIYVDSRHEALAEAGDLLIPMRAGVIPADAIRADLGELALHPERGRRTPDEVTVFKSVGLAVEDLVVARGVLEAATAAGLGTAV